MCIYIYRERERYFIYIYTHIHIPNVILTASGKGADKLIAASGKRSTSARRCIPGLAATAWRARASSACSSRSRSGIVMAWFDRPNQKPLPPATRQPHRTAIHVMTAKATNATKANAAFQGPKQMASRAVHGPTACLGHWLLGWCPRHARSPGRGDLSLSCLRAEAANAPNRQPQCHPKLT